MAFSVLFFDLGDTLVNASTRTWLPGAKEVLTSLRQKGTRLGIISNTGDLADRKAILDMLPVDFDLKPFESELVLFSSEIGIQKPHRQIFEKAIKAAGVPADQCLFCADGAVETLVAQATGMHTLRVVTGSTDLSNLESFLAEFESHS